MKSYSATNSEVIFYSFGIGSVYLATILVMTEELVPGMEAFSSTRSDLHSY